MTIYRGLQQVIYALSDSIFAPKKVKAKPKTQLCQPKLYNYAVEELKQRQVNVPVFIYIYHTNVHNFIHPERTYTTVTLDVQMLTVLNLHHPGAVEILQQLIQTILALIIRHPVMDRFGSENSKLKHEKLLGKHITTIYMYMTLLVQIKQETPRVLVLHKGKESRKFWCCSSEGK